MFNNIQHNSPLPYLQYTPRDKDQSVMRIDFSHIDPSSLKNYSRVNFLPERSSHFAPTLAKIAIFEGGSSICLSVYRERRRRCIRRPYALCVGVDPPALLGEMSDVSQTNPMLLSFSHKGSFRVAIMCKSQETACRATAMDPLTCTDLVILHPSFISTPRSRKASLIHAFVRPTFSFPLSFPQHCTTQFFPIHMVFSNVHPMSMIHREKGR